MKKFAIVLMMALLVLGCVFAASGDSQKTDDRAVTSGDKFIVTTTIDTIYPVYMISGSNNAKTVWSATTPTDSNKIEAIKVYDATTHQLTDVQIEVSLIHFGYQENDTSKNRTYIRYCNKVTITIEAKELINTLYGTSLPAGHVERSNAPTVTAKEGIDSTTDFKDTVTSTDNKVTVVAEYLTGKKVGNTSFDQSIATCIFKWKVEDLTAGDTYEADVVVTYTNV